MPVTTGVQGYTSLTQQTRLCLETGAAPGESLLMPLTTGTATMSLTTQPNTISATTGMHLHFFIFGNATAGTIGIVGTNATGGGQTSITYHVPAAPQQAQGYSEFTTKEAWGTVTASNITLTTLTPCQVMVYGSFAGKYLLPISLDKEEKITHHAPQDKRGILFKNFRVVQLTKSTDVAKLDSDLYPDSLWAYYMAIGNTPMITTVPAAPVSLLAATTKAATMTLTTSLSTMAPGAFLIFAIANANVATGTIVLSGTDTFGNAQSETITVPATNGTVYSTKRYASITNSGADKFATTGLTTGATIAVTAVFAWNYAWTFDGINNITPYSASIEAYDGVEGVILPGTILTDLTLDWQKEKEILLQAKGLAQDFLVVGDPTNTSSIGSNPFPALAQPTTLPYVSWPASFYIDAASGTPATTQDGSMLTFKLAITTGRKWFYPGDGFQRPTFVTWDTEPDWTLDAEIVYQNYQNYINYFKPNVALILATTFQGNWLGTIAITNYYESVNITLPAKVDTFKVDQTTNPVKGKLKLISQYDPTNLNYAYKVTVTAQVPPTYTS
ncbi:MAG: hypothetical protein H0W02_10170 [Ktedonobacteraceae bacterium]|nr:hypothetical protein [Ktedonobacteraceae bacterium]